MSEIDSGAAGTWSYRRGDWFAVFGDKATVVLPSSQKEQVIALWGLVEGGAGFDEVLDGLLASGLSRLSGFVLISDDGSPTRVLLRGQGVTASIVAATGAESRLDGAASHTWVEQTVDDLTRLRISLPADADTAAGEPAEIDFPIVAGLVRVAQIDWPAASAPAPAAAADPVVAVADDPAAVAADEMTAATSEPEADLSDGSTSAAGPGSVVAGAGVAGAGLAGAGLAGAGLAGAGLAAAGLAAAAAASPDIPRPEAAAPMPGDAAGAVDGEATAEGVVDESASCEDEASAAPAPAADDATAGDVVDEPASCEDDASAAPAPAADVATADEGPATEVLDEVDGDLAAPEPPAPPSGRAMGDPLTDPLDMVAPEAAEMGDAADSAGSGDDLAAPGVAAAGEMAAAGEDAAADRAGSGDDLAAPGVAAAGEMAAAGADAGADDSDSDAAAPPEVEVPPAPSGGVVPPPPPAPEGWVTPWDNPVDVPPPSSADDPHPLEEPDTPAVPPVLPTGATEVTPPGWVPPPPPSDAGVADPADAPPLGIGAWEPLGGDAADHDGLTVAGAAEEPEQPANQLPGQPPAPAVTQPVAKLVISDGQTIVVDRAVLIGRAPEARRFSSTEQPVLVTVPSRLHEISSTHVEVRPGTGADHGTAVVTDMGSTNGTVLVQPGLGPEDLKPGIAVQLIPGAIVNLGDGITIQVTRP